MKETGIRYAIRMVGTSAHLCGNGKIILGWCSGWSPRQDTLSYKSKVCAERKLAWARKLTASPLELIEIEQTIQRQ